MEYIFQETIELSIKENRMVLKSTVLENHESSQDIKITNLP